MAHPRMDDAAYLTTLLTEWGAPATLQAARTAGGFTTLATVAFAAEEGSDEAPVIRALLHVTDDPLPVTPAVATPSEAAVLQRLLRLPLLPLCWRDPLAPSLRRRWPRICVRNSCLTTW